MAAGDGPRPPVLTRLARLAADMRTRVKRRSWAMGAGAAAGERPRPMGLWGVRAAGHSEGRSQLVKAITSAAILRRN